MSQGRIREWFSTYLRTGRRVRVVETEVKFNPWHDPDDGRFTFVGQGRYYPNGYVIHGARRRRSAGARQVHDYGGRRKPSKEDPYVPDRSDLDPRHPRNYSIHIVRRGDTLTTIAEKRRGLRASDLAWLNGVSLNDKLRIGQAIKLPRQSFLDDGLRARNKFLALALYMDTHGGRMPPDPANPPSVAQQLSAVHRTVTANRYEFHLGIANQTLRIKGELYFGSEKRSKRYQRDAGKPDRLPSDHGGHFIARRFNGPRESFNHFAQDSSFNKRAYAALENRWAKLLKENPKRRIFFDMQVIYEGASLRPSWIIVDYTVDGHKYRVKFSNSSESLTK